MFALRVCSRSHCHSFALPLAVRTSQRAIAGWIVEQQRPAHGVSSAASSVFFTAAIEKSGMTTLRSFYQWLAKSRGARKGRVAVHSVDSALAQARCVANRTAMDLVREVEWLANRSVVGTRRASKGAIGANDDVNAASACGYAASFALSHVAQATPAITIAVVRE